MVSYALIEILRLLFQLQTVNGSKMIEAPYDYSPFLPCSFGGTMLFPPQQCNCVATPLSNGTTASSADGSLAAGKVAFKSLKAPSTSVISAPVFMRS
ncbi:hypothetical protein XENTR_v10017148 [Xenopus tropicalis]|nr:hypothetical protein XENTR_v10017148 [Xenopus tropicalis]